MGTMDKKAVILETFHARSKQINLQTYYNLKNCRPGEP